MDLVSSIRLAEVVATVFYALLGLGLIVFSYWLLDRITHFSLHEELAEKQNTAVAIVVGSVFIALAILIANVIRS